MKETHFLSHMLTCEGGDVVNVANMKTKCVNCNKRAFSDLWHEEILLFLENKYICRNNKFVYTLGLCPYCLNYTIYFKT